MSCDIDRINTIYHDIDINDEKYHDLTETERKYIINKLHSFEQYWNDDILYNYISFRALNNNYKLNLDNLKIVLMYLNWKNPSPEKWKTFIYLLSFLKHNENKFSKIEYKDLMEDIFSSTLDIHIKE